ncbi:MAG: DUF3553 domain-containing protein [Alphaproteobacteria bacterium]|nr:DUF3553 domain-containing protein [Alphaproteobacteria bacterium]
MNQHFVPGTLVRQPDRPDWGLGRILAAASTGVTVNFEHAGQLLLDPSAVRLVRVEFSGR